MTVRIDLSPSSLLTFEREKEEAKQFLRDRRGLNFLLDWGPDPLFKPSEPFLLALDEFNKELFSAYQSVLKAIFLFPLDQNFFLSPLKQSEEAEFVERNSFRIDLFRRDLLSEFLAPLIPTLGEGTPLRLEVEGPPYWLHPDKFPWMERKKNSSTRGVLLPGLETEEVFNAFEQINFQDARIITEQNLSLEWEGLEDLYYVEKGVTFQGKRALKGFEAAGGNLIHNQFPSS
jgi:hypothetical protein